MGRHERNTSNRRRVAQTPATALLCALVLAACSGGDSAAPTTVAADTTTVPSTIGPTTTAAVVPSTTPTTTPTTTIPPPTTAPTTIAPAPPATSPFSTDAPPSIRDLAPEIEADWREGLRRYELAATTPNDAAAVAAALEYTIDTVYDGTESFLTQLAADDQRAVLDDEQPTTHTILEGPTRDAQAPLVFSMVVCEVNTWNIVRDQPDGAVDTLSDDIVTMRWAATIRLDAGLWKLAALVPIERWEGVTTCEQ